MYKSLDFQYSCALKHIILQDGEYPQKNTADTPIRTKWKEDGSPAYYKSIFSVVNTYNVGSSLPYLTLRDTPGKNIKNKLHVMAAEMLWHYQMASNDKKDFNFRIFDDWMNEKGNLGTAYGYQIAKTININGFSMNQMEALLWKLKHDSNDRAMITMMYNFEDLPYMTIRPCAFMTQWFVDSDNRLHMTLYQRSQDMVVAGGWNPTQYALLLHMVAIHCGLEVGTLTHHIGDCHVYDRHEEFAIEMMNRCKSGFPSPKLIINPDVKSFWDFKYTDFELDPDTFQCHPGFDNIPVAI